MNQLFVQTKKNAFELFELNKDPSSYLYNGLQHKKMALFLDIDGTLVDFSSQPDNVRLTHSMRKILFKLNKQLASRVAFVTGRSVGSADKVTAMPEITIAGVHGAEFRLLKKHKVCGVAFSKKNHLTIKQALDDLIIEYPELFYEDKNLSFALHYNKNKKLKNVCFHFMKTQKLLSRTYTLLSGHQVIELKSCSFDKGTAIEYLMKQSIYQNKIPCFIGDDITDEHAFIAVNQLDGISIKVLHECMSDNNANSLSAANYYLNHVDDTEQFLLSLNRL